MSSGVRSSSATKSPAAEAYSLRGTNRHSTVVECPICGKHVSRSDIQRHADMCARAQEPVVVKPKPIPRQRPRPKVPKRKKKKMTKKKSSASTSSASRPSQSGKSRKSGSVVTTTKVGQFTISAQSLPADIANQVRSVLASYARDSEQKDAETDSATEEASTLKRTITPPTLQQAERRESRKRRAKLSVVNAAKTK